MKKRWFSFIFLATLAGLLLFLSPFTPARLGAISGCQQAKGSANSVLYFPWICRKAVMGTIPPSSTATLTPTRTPPPGDLPDLAIPSGWGVRYDGCPWGSPGSIWVKVENQGQAGAGLFIVTINHATTTVEGLAVHAVIQASVHFERGPVGGIDAFADSLDWIAESNESNNRFRILFTAPPPCPSPSTTQTPARSTFTSTGTDAFGYFPWVSYHGQLPSPTMTPAPYPVVLDR